MTHHHKAHGLASLGRHGDTMLVHMSPQEVQGLESIARMQGTKLTRNPETGMPEAFNLGGFFKSFLPTVAGMGISAMFPGASPWLIGTLAGVGTTLATGNPLAGIMTGLGVGGGMGLGKGIFNIGDKLPAVAGSEVAESVAASELAKQGAASQAGQAISPMMNNPSMVAQQASTAAALPSYTNQLGAFNNPAFNTATMQAPTSAVIGQNLNTFGAGLKESFNNPTALIDELGGGSQAAFKLGTPVLGATMNGLEPSDLGYATNQTIQSKPVDINKPLNLNYDTGLKLYAAGGSISAGGINNLYGTRDDQSIQQANLSQNGFGLGRLNALGNEQSLDQAKIYGYADGGDVGMNLDKLPSLNVNTGRQGYSGGSGDVLASMDPNDPMVQQFFRPGIEKLRAQNNALYGDGPDNILNTMGPNDPIMQKFLRPGIEKMRAQNNALYGTAPLMSTDDPMGKMLNLGVDKMRAQHSSLYGMAKGGYLDGQGDGMSDSIPATIEGKQPARLADGEFVVPADVVSHIGNGSSKAGSKRLYAMLHKVRKARTGNPKQGKQINPNKYMPA